MTGISTLAEGTTVQSREISKISKHMHSSRKHIEDGLRTVENMVDSSNQTSSIAEEGSKNINEVVSQFDWVNKTIEYATDSIQKLGQRSRQPERERQERDFP